jgi:ankyrin repeat protein
VAEFLIKQLTKESKQNKEVQDLLLNEVLLKPDYQVIRAFLDGLIGKSKPSQVALEYYGGKLNEHWNERKVKQTLTGGETVLHIAAREDNSCIIEFLLDSLKSGEYINTLTEILLADDKWGDNACLMAVTQNNVLALQQIRKWADEAHLSSEK